MVVHGHGPLDSSDCELRIWFVVVILIRRRMPRWRHVTGTDNVYFLAAMGTRRRTVVDVLTATGTLNLV